MHSVRDLKGLECPANVNFDRGQRDAHLLANMFVAMALRDERDDWRTISKPA